MREGALASFYTVSWSKGFQVLDISDTRFSLQQVTGKDYTLTINELMKQAAGSYSCEVSVNFGNGNWYRVKSTFIQVLVYGKRGRDAGMSRRGGEKAKEEEERSESRKGEREDGQKGERERTKGKERGVEPQLSM